MRKVIFYRYLILIAIILETFSILDGYLPIPKFEIMGITIIIGFFLYPKAFMNKMSFYYSLFWVIVLLNILLRGTFVVNWFIAFFLSLTFSFSVFCIFKFNQDFKGLKIISITGLLIIVTTSIINIPILTQNPLYAREIMSASRHGDSQFVELGKKLGVIGYGLVHSIPMLFPLVIYKIKNYVSNKERILWLGILVIFFLLILKVSFGTVMILTIIIIPFSFLWSNNLKRNIKLLTFAGIVFLLFSNGTLINYFLDYTKIYFEDTRMYLKIDDIQNSINSNSVEGQLKGRSDLYLQSLTTFIDNPFFGTNNASEAGGHTFAGDFLAWFGILGVIPFFLFFVRIFKVTYKKILRERGQYYVLSIVPFVLLSLTKGTPGFEQFLYLIVIIPGLFITLKTNKSLKISQI